MNLSNDANPASILGKYGRSIVSGAIIDNNDFTGGVRLGEDALNGFTDNPSPIVGRNNDGEFNHVGIHH
jgi:hypothetical protein